MKYAPFVDILILLLNIFIAVAYRGTVWGWLSTGFVIFYVWMIVTAIKES